MDNLKRIGAIEEIFAACRRATPVPMTYAEPQPMTLAERLNVSDLSHTFTNFKVLPGTEECFKLFQTMSEGECDTPLGFCYGSKGNGKTYLLESLVIRLNERGLYTRYHTWVDVLSNIRRFLNHQPEQPSADEIIDRWCKVPRLVVDDVGMGTTDTNWELSILERIIGFRYHMKLFTALATNKDPSKELPERILSRLADKERCTMVINRGKDYRMTKSQHPEKR